MMDTMPGGEEIVMHEISKHDYVCSSCGISMAKVSSRSFKCTKCGLTYRE